MANEDVNIEREFDRSADDAMEAYYQGAPGVERVNDDVVRAVQRILGNEDLPNNANRNRATDVISILHDPGERRATRTLLDLLTPRLTDAPSVLSYLEIIQPETLNRYQADRRRAIASTLQNVVGMDQALPAPAASA
ncbi:MAG: hypothetical protein ACD_63C00111G0003, partial [uncultured bacterium]